MPNTKMTEKFFKPFLVCGLAALTQYGFATSPSQPEGWQYLFNGKDLSGWHSVGGEAKYRVENAMIVGEAVVDTPNTFLVTKERYGDFILEYEAKHNDDLNSGMLIRSNLRSNGEPFGYQVEMDETPRSWSGGIYDEKRRGWLYSLSRNKACRLAFKKNDWNLFRVEAIRHKLRTWVNGIPCANLVDDLTAEGFLGMQVHHILKNSEKAGHTTFWRNIRIKTKNLKPSPEMNIPEFSFLNNQLTERQKKEGWKLLWDGKSTQGWRGARIDHFPKNGWVIKEGTLNVIDSNGGESTNGGDIITREEFTDFELEVDFKITKGANSGIKYFVDPDLRKDKGSAIGLEFQILDDQHHPDAMMGVRGNRTMGSLYDLIKAENLSEAGRTEKRVNTTGLWNRARIVVKGSEVEHWLNNSKIVEFNRHSQLFRALVAHSKYRNWPSFGEWEKGPILLQDHGYRVSYRNIKIRDLSKN